jgi:hypothetical protein
VQSGEGAAGAVVGASEGGGVQEEGGAGAGVKGLVGEGGVEGEGGEVFCCAEGAEGH